MASKESSATNTDKFEPPASFRAAGLHPVARSINVASTPPRMNRRVPCSRLREHVFASPDAHGGASLGHGTRNPSTHP